MTAFVYVCIPTDTTYIYLTRIDSITGNTLSRFILNTNAAVYGSQIVMDNTSGKIIVVFNYADYTVFQYMTSDFIKIKTLYSLDYYANVD